MTVESFQQLCDEFCDAAKTPRQVLEADEGVMTFSMTLSDVVVNVMHVPASHAACFVLVDFGPVPEVDTSEVLLALMRVNFSLIGGEPATSFGVHPVFGTVTLQSVYPFRDRSGAQLLQSLTQLVEMALQWRETRFLETSEDDSDAPRETLESAAPQARGVRV